MPNCICGKRERAHPMSCSEEVNDDGLRRGLIRRFPRKDKVQRPLAVGLEN